MTKNQSACADELETIHQRFKEAIQCLITRGDLQPSSREKGISQFAERVFGNVSTGIYWTST